MGYAFDDGPNCTHNAFYDFLASNNQKATMFYIGSNVMDWPYEAQRGLVDGHEICAREYQKKYSAVAYRTSGIELIDVLCLLQIPGRIVTVSFCPWRLVFF